MSTSPIGTVFPAVADSALVKVGIPTGDNFSMLDGSVPVASLLAMIPSSNVVSGTYIPTLGSAVSISSLTVVGESTYFQIGNLVQGTIRVQGLVTALTDASFSFSLPINSTPFPDENSMHCTIGLFNPTTDVTKYEANSFALEVLGAVNISPTINGVIDAVITFNYLVA